ncbi:hypothetical protein D9M68_753030 [compost metagenome]
MLPSRSALFTLFLSRRLLAQSVRGTLKRAPAGVLRSRPTARLSICSCETGLTKAPSTARPLSFAIRLMLLAMRREQPVTMASMGVKSWRASSWMNWAPSMTGMFTSMTTRL